MVGNGTKIDELIHRLLYYKSAFGTPKKQISTKDEALQAEKKLQDKGWLRAYAILNPKQQPKNAQEKYSPRQSPAHIISLEAISRYLENYLKDLVESDSFSYKPKRKSKNRDGKASKKIYRLKPTKQVFNKIWLRYLTKRKLELFIDSDYYKGIKGDNKVRELYFNFYVTLMNFSNDRIKRLKKDDRTNKFSVHSNAYSHKIAPHMYLLEPAFKLFIEKPASFKERIGLYHEFLNPLELVGDIEFFLFCVIAGFDIFLNNASDPKSNQENWFKNCKQMLLKDTYHLLYHYSLNRIKKEK